MEKKIWSGVGGGGVASFLIQLIGIKIKEMGADVGGLDLLW